MVAIESSSDERSTTVPSTEGQRTLSTHLQGFFGDLGCAVSVDEHANVIARLDGRGRLSEASPLALMIHLDTARGTEARKGLCMTAQWDGSPVAYPDNDRLQVSIENYPSTAIYRGHDLLHGGGSAPFGLDDKLGLAHMMTLARLLAENPEIEHRPVLLIGRPDEEIGREEALLGLATYLAEQGVDSGYTVDGLDPFEVNVENFNAMGASLRFADRTAEPIAQGQTVEIVLEGVNTHGATAKAEGHRGALRFATELCVALRSRPVSALGFESDALRDCDGRLWLHVADTATRAALDTALETIVGPHALRGAGWTVNDNVTYEGRHAGATATMLSLVAALMASRSDVPLMCEDSDGFEGYTYPYRARIVDGQVQLDIRLRDFDRSALQRRRDDVIVLAKNHAEGITTSVVEQYSNMAPKLAHRSDLLEAALAAAVDIGATAKRQPIRGGTGVDPFLDRGVFVANLGTGYFAPESEKEFTSMQFLAQHALWLLALVQRDAPPPNGASGPGVL